MSLTTEQEIILPLLMKTAEQEEVDLHHLANVENQRRRGLEKDGLKNLTVIMTPPLLSRAEVSYLG